MNTYTVTQQRRGSYTDRTGRTVRFEEWVEVVTLQASSTGSALRQADAKWPAYAGKHRARLIQTTLRPALCADDRSLIHSLTTQTI